MKKFINNQDGSTSLLTVMFFLLFMSILSVSFLHIVSDERERSMENEASSAALAAAQSGVEDAKRIILYCQNNTGNPSIKQKCDFALNQPENSDCTKVIGSFNQLLNTTNNEVSVDSPNKQYDEKYDCLFITTATATAEFELTAITDGAGSSTIIPLKTANNVVISSFELKWHKYCNSNSVYDGCDGTSVKFDNLPQNNPKSGSWNGPAMVRIQIVKTAKNNTTVLDSRAVLLRPNSNGSVNVNFGGYSPSQNPNEATIPLSSAKCNKPNTGDYACGVKLSMSGFMNDTNSDYYARIYTVYSGTHIELGNINNQKEAVKFDNIQPMIDVTGHSGNTRRRLLTRVQLIATLNEGLVFPEFAVESTGTVCKQIISTIKDKDSKDNCQY